MNLKELLEKYGNQLDDMSIIKKFIIENNKEDEALKMIPEIAANKIDNLNYSLNYSRTWIPVTRVCLNDPDFEIEEKLKQIMEYSILYPTSNIEDILPESLLDWAKENIPNINTPNIYFRDTINRLSQIGINFKDHERYNL